MTKILIAALFVAAGPVLALAQSTPNNSRVEPMPSQTNLQDQANQNMQPQNARPTQSGPGLGQANAIPTPTMNNKPMSATPGDQTVPHAQPRQ